MLDEAGEPWFDEVDVALAAATLVGLLAAPPAGAVLAATLARRVSINILRRALQRLLSRQSTTGIFKRPKGVPQDWIMKPADKGVGVVFTKPGSKGGTYVKIQKGNPNSSQPGQRYDNVRWQKDGQPYDVNANPVPRNSQESHIPVKDFKFDPELFK